MRKENILFLCFILSLSGLFIIVCVWQTDYTNKEISRIMEDRNKQDSIYLNEKEEFKKYYDWYYDSVLKVKHK